MYLLQSEIKKPEEEWYDVGIIRGTVCTVQAYYLPTEADSLKNESYTDAEGEVTERKASGIEVKLQPGTAYKFRVAGINPCGRGPWSEVSAFKTCLPGYPGAPSAIKISKSAEGAHLSWEPPQNAAGDIVEYSVYLAIRNAATQQQVGKKVNFTWIFFFENVDSAKIIPVQIHVTLYTLSLSSLSHLPSPHSHCLPLVSFLFVY